MLYVHHESNKTAIQIGFYEHNTHTKKHAETQRTKRINKVNFLLQVNKTQKRVQAYHKSTSRITRGIAPWADDRNACSIERALLYSKTPPNTTIVPRPDNKVTGLPNTSTEAQIIRARFTVFETLQ